MKELRPHQLIIKSLEDIMINNDTKLIKKANISKLNYFFTKNEWKFSQDEKIKIWCLVEYLKKMKDYLHFKKGNIELMKEELI
jgi:hypothetical protein